MLLAQDSGDHSGENIARSSRCHARIAGGIDMNGTVRSRDDRPMPFQDDVGVSPFGKIGGDFYPIPGDVFDTFLDEPGHLAGMRREYRPTEFTLKADKGIQAVCV